MVSNASFVILPPRMDIIIYGYDTIYVTIIFLYRIMALTVGEEFSSFGDPLRNHTFSFSAGGDKPWIVKRVDTWLEFRQHWDDDPIVLTRKDIQKKHPYFSYEGDD